MIYSRLFHIYSIPHHLLPACTVTTTTVFSIVILKNWTSSFTLSLKASSVLLKILLQIAPIKAVSLKTETFSLDFQLFIQVLRFPSSNNVVSILVLVLQVTISYGKLSVSHEPCGGSRGKTRAHSYRMA